MRPHSGGEELSLGPNQATPPPPPPAGLDLRLLGGGGTAVWMVYLSALLPSQLRPPPLPRPSDPLPLP